MPDLRTRFLIPLASAALVLACAQTIPSARTEPEPPIQFPGTTKASDLPGIHNVVTYSPGVYTGAVPEGSAGFATLAALGVRTVISVDGAKPDVAEAKAHGLRYVHLPIGYDGVSETRGQELAEAFATLPGPIYVHCHHGKHRSAAAVGTGCVVAGLLTVDEALARMKASGTGAEYQGLFAAVREAKPMPMPIPKRATDAARFPEVAQTRGVVEAMTEVDVVFDLLKAVRAAGYTVPKNHSDLVPAREAERLAGLLSDTSNDDESKGQPARYFELLDQAVAAANDLSAGLSRPDTAVAENEKRWKAVEKSCKECHASYRDKRR